MNNREIGNIYEENTINYLKDKKYQILEKNYLRKTGEIDIIGFDQDTLVFFEVKYRKSSKYGHPSEVIDYYKKQHIIKTAMWYAKEKNWFDKPVRFDVIIWEDNQISHYEGAFDLDG